MREDRSVMSYRLMKWALFTVLFLTAPALLFLVQVVMFIPAIFFAAGILFMIPKAVVSSSSMETLTFIGIFGVHLLIYAAIYMLISMVVAKLLSLIANSITRIAAFALVCLGFASVALFPVYGGGGHGPSYRGRLLYVFQEVNRDYGSNTVVIVYGACILCVTAWSAYRKHQRNRIGNVQI